MADEIALLSVYMQLPVKGNEVLLVGIINCMENYGS
jgi:hypothetical protein